jgi:hypothetical protein
MTWQEKHDIVLKWIDSCVTPEQLQNMVIYVKTVSYENNGLLFWIRMKCYQMQANVIVNSLVKIRSIIA